MTVKSIRPTGRSGSVTKSTSKAASARRNEIVEAAAILFEQRGYHQTVIDDIADAVGMQKSTVYHYFTSKDQILFAIHEAFIRGVYEQQLARSRSGGLTEREELAQIIQDVVDVIHRKRSHVKVFFEYYRELLPEDRERIRNVRHAYTALVRDIIARGVGSGVFLVKDVDVATFAFFGTVNWVYQWYRPGDRLAPRDVADTLWRYAIAGLSGRLEAP